MKKNLFLTGPVGCGKSTSIASALADKLAGAGGFLTVRQKDDTGRAVAYWLQRPDGSDRQIIIDYSARPYTMHMEVFEGFAAALLDEAKRYDYVILDEIGGFEVLSDAFMAALMSLLESDIPCIGVMKPEGPATKLICKLGLDQRFEDEAAKLRRWMGEDPDTVVYEFSQYDPKGLELCRTFMEKYCR